MNKNFYNVVFCAFFAVVSVSAMADQSVKPKPVRVSPFSDNLQVIMQNFPAQATLTMSYTDNNDVNISGPSSVSASLGAFPVTVASNNFIQNGFPIMTITYPSNVGTQTCTFQFVDGPYTYLNFAAGVPPTCTNLSVSPIQNGYTQYSYTMTIAYQSVVAR